MKMMEMQSLDELNEVFENCQENWNERGICISKILETKHSYSFRIFKHGNTLYFYFYNKKL